MHKIMIIEDTEKIRTELKEFLSRYGYDVVAPIGFSTIISDIESEDPDLLLLDINLPIYDGYYICREVRKNSNLPIIIVTSRDSEMDELMSMNLGADDFVTKPYNLQILLARISSVLRRSSSSQSSDVLSHNGILLNLSKSTVSCGSIEEDLTKNELKILHCLMKNKGAIVSRDTLMESLWDSDIFVDDNTLTVNINRLRKKLSTLGREDAVETKRGQGYIIIWIFLNILRIKFRFYA